jgi:Fic family protein
MSGADLLMERWTFREGLVTAKLASHVAGISVRAARRAIRTLAKRQELRLWRPYQGKRGQAALWQWVNR